MSWEENYKAWPGQEPRPSTILCQHPANWPTLSHDSFTSFQIMLCPYDTTDILWAASSEFGIYRLCEQRRFRRACASAQSRPNLSCSLIQAVSQEEPSDKKPDPWPLWIAWHAQLKFVMTECSKTNSLDGSPMVYLHVIKVICMSMCCITLGYWHITSWCNKPYMWY